jgi:hypothetical protein
MVLRTCTFERGKIDVQFAFDAQGKIAGLNIRPSGGAPPAYSLPSYATASAYTESAITIGSGEWTLPGTLTLPTGDASVPSCVTTNAPRPIPGRWQPFRASRFAMKSLTTSSKR